MGNVIWTVRSTDFDYWAAYVGSDDVHYEKKLTKNIRPNDI